MRMKRFMTLVLVCLLMPTMAFAEAYRRGDSGQGVATYQQKLYEMGYLNGEVDGEFGTATEKSVKAFQKSRGMTQSGVLDQETIMELNMSYVGCKDPDTEIVLGFSEWRNKGSNQLEFRTQVTNTNPYDDYAVIEIACYCEDARGNRVFPEEGYYWCTKTEMKLPYGVRKYTAYTTLKNRSDIANVYVAVKMVENEYGLGYASEPETLYFVCFPVS
ncbi:MAG: peptidoglycan-binding domain-containing protein [Clostridia bacterium]|nr:peptidoglycan-binding domain-containing protein [Clostridia bacterium]